MARPRLDIDEAEVRRLHAKGWGARRIGKKLKASRSVIQRILSGKRTPNDRDESSRFARSPRGPCAENVSGAGSEPAQNPDPSRAALPSSDRPAPKCHSDVDRRHAHRLLEIARWRANDDEYERAKALLDDLLYAEPETPVKLLADRATNQMSAWTREREDAAQARVDWAEAAKSDLETRWEQEVALATRRIDRIRFERRWAIREALKGEYERATTLLDRRLGDLRTGKNVASLVDRLVEDGLERVAHLLEGLR